MGEQGKGIQQPYQTEIMVAMKMRDENVRNLSTPYFVFDHLYLRSFAAIDQIIIPVMGYDLAGWVAVKCRNGRIISQDSYRQHGANKAVKIKQLSKPRQSLFDGMQVT